MRTLNEALREAELRNHGIYADLLAFDQGGDGRTHSLLFAASCALDNLNVQKGTASEWLISRYERKYPGRSSEVEKVVSMMFRPFVSPEDENGNFRFNTADYGTINDRAISQSRNVRSRAFDKETIEANVAEAVDAGNRLPSSPEDVAETTREILKRIYHENDLICIGENRAIPRTATLAEHEGNLNFSEFIVANPMEKREGTSLNGNPSMRCKDNAITITSFIVFETDSVKSKKAQKSIIALLARTFPLLLVVDSGNRSLHAWFKSPATEKSRKKAKEVFAALGGDPSVLQPWQWVRMPNGTREDGTRQEVVYFDPSATSRRTDSHNVVSLWKHFVQNDPAYSNLYQGCPSPSFDRPAIEQAENSPSDAEDESEDSERGQFVMPGLLTYSDLKADYSKPLKAVIHEVVSVGEKLMISAPSKAGKTWIVLNLAKAISEGKEWFGFKTRKGKVLYLNFELSNQRLRERIERMGGFNSNVQIATFRGELVEWIGLKHGLEALEEKYSLIILDPIYKMLGGVNENDNAEVAELLHHVERIACSMGAAIVFAHHFSKGNKSHQSQIDRASGAGAWARDPDALLTLTEHDEDGCYTLEAALRNYRSPAPTVWRQAFPHFIREPEKDPAALKGRRGGSNSKQDVSQDQIRNAMESNPEGLTRTALKSRLVSAGISKTTAYDCIKKSLRRGAIEERDGKLFLPSEDKLI